MIRRRDILKVIGVGGILPFVKHETPPEVPAPKIETQVQPQVYTLGSATTGDVLVCGNVYAMRSGNCHSIAFTRRATPGDRILGIDQDGYLVLGGGGDA